MRELLAERLGDRSLNIAYWLPERGIFVDDAGRPVELPAPGSGRAWTAVEHEGKRVAAIVHDAELDASPELVTAAASAAALAIDNERLKAELRARVEELRVSRLRIVEAADDARRRIERDLHDGAQQQLVCLALDLRMLKARLGDSGLVDHGRRDRREARGRARRAARVRARDPPAFLSERGVGAAVEALVARAPMNVDASVELDERLPGAGRGRRLLRDRRGADQRRALRGDPPTRGARQPPRRGVVVVVSDEGVGGATLAGGTGLRGLIDRLAVLDGRLEVTARRAAARGWRRTSRSSRGRWWPRRRRGRCTRPPAAPWRSRSSLLALAGCGARRPTCARRDLVVSGDDAVATRAAPDQQRGACGSPARGSSSSRTGRRRTRSGRSSSAGSRTPAARPAPRSPTARRTASRSRACAGSSTRPSPTAPTGSSSRCRTRRRSRRRSARRSRAGIPVVTINSGSDEFKSLGVLAHVGQPEYRAGVESGERMGRAGVRRALCVNQESGNSGLDERCRGFADGLRRSAGTLAPLAVPLQDPATAQRRMAAAITEGPIDGILTLGPGGALPAIDALRASGLESRVISSRRSTSHPRCWPPCVTATCCSRSTSSRTCRATCR